MSNNVVNYNFGSFRKIGENTIGYLEGWTFAPKNGEMLRERVVNVKGADKKVVSFNISTNLAKSTMNYYFGEEFNKELHFIECSAWGQLAERIVKFGLSPKMLIGLFGEVKVVEYEAQTGEVKKKLVMTVDNFKAISKKINTTKSVDNLDLIEIDDDDLPF